VLSGKRVDLTLVQSEDECAVWADLYNKLEEREDFDHTEVVSASRLKELYRQNGFWTPQGGTLLIKNKTGHILGEISFTSTEFSEVTLGYRLFERSNRRKGYTTEALALFCRYLLDTLPINRISLRISADNIASTRLAAKLGFIHEGTLRKAYFYRGRFVDFLIYGLLREEFSADS